MKIYSLADDTFDERLLLEKKISGLLPVDKCTIDGRGQFWISITGMQSLDTFLEVKEIGISFIEQLIISITGEIELLEKNLININCLILEESFIFVENQQQIFHYIVLPDQEIPLSEQFRSLMEYLLTRIDHKDQEAVRAAYLLYEKTLNDGYSIKDIRTSIVENRVKSLESPENMYQPELEIQEEKSEDDYIQEMMEEYGGGFESFSSRMKKRARKKSIIDWLIQMLFPDHRNPRIEENHQSSENKGAWEKHRHMGACQKNRNEDIYLTPDLPMEEEAVPEIHPTVCLGSYHSHPEGLFLYEGKEAFETFRIRNPENLIGQGKDVDISLKKDTISHFHARILMEEEEYYIEDLNSTNGTFINGQPLAYKERKKLNMNDIVRFADVRFRFV